MSTAYRSNRKATDQDIIRLNSVGLSLNAIGERLGCHPTTITLRLKALNIEPADTRRAFMEEIYDGMGKAQQDWLEAQLGPHTTIKDFIKNMLVKEYLASKQPEPV